MTRILQKIFPCIQQTNNPMVQKPQNRAVELALPALSRSEKVSRALITAVKITFAPITLLIFLANKSLSFLACSQGLGSHSAKNIDMACRNYLHFLGGEDIRFGLKGKSALEGMYFENNGTLTNPKTILLCTGSHQSYEYYAVPMVEALQEMGHNVMVFNYEGFGQSEGSRSEEGVYRSVEAAYQYLKQKKGCADDSIVAWGYSLGSGAVSELAAKHTVDIVLDRGFSSMSQVASQVAPRGLKTIAKIIFMAGAHFNNLKKLPKAKGKVFIAQGNADTQMTKGQHGESLMRALATNNKAIYREVNSAHLHGQRVWFSQGSDRQAVEQFLGS